MIGVYDYTVLLTYMSFLSALTGIHFAVNGNTFIAILCLMFSGLCDMFDGKVARTKKNRTEEDKKFGIQIDSLSDLVAFGVLPSVIGYGLGIGDTWMFPVLYLLPLCGLIRLAYFNVNEEIRSSKTDEARTEYLGLPVTSTAIILPVIYFLKKITETYFIYIYAISLLIISILFIKKFKMVKLKTKGLVVLAGIGTIVFILLLVWYL